MNKLAKLAMWSLGALLVIATPALAQDGEQALITFSGAFGAGLVTIGAAAGIGKLAVGAFESMARQPEKASQIQTAMIIAAALIEGFTLFALVICMGP